MSDPSLIRIRAVRLSVQDVQLFLDVDRTKAATLGVSLSDVNQTLDMYLGSLYVNSFNQFGRQYKTYLMADDQYRMRPEDLSQYYSKDKDGNLVPPINPDQDGLGDWNRDPKF